MCGITLLLLYLFMGIVTAQEPTITTVTASSSFSCSDEYLVVGGDFATFEVDLSGNNSDYTYDAFNRPRFRIQELLTENGTTVVVRDSLICLPFDLPENGFCVRRDLTNTTGCSCEVVGPQVYRVKTVYRIEDVSESRGRIQLLWPSLSGPLSRFSDLPEVRESCRLLEPTPTPSGPGVVSHSDSEKCSTECIVGSVFGGIVGFIIIIILVVSCLLHRCGCVHIRCYDRCCKQNKKHPCCNQVNDEEDPEKGVPKGQSQAASGETDKDAQSPLLGNEGFKEGSSHRTQQL